MAHNAKTVIEMTLPYEREKHRKITAIEDGLARQTKAGDIVLGILATLGVVALVLVIALLTGWLEFPDPS
ncbi:hypothetical protein [Microvirga zambiensis]|uniref:hypothetical protein n=1 Tax=Microvirga zambiensis TaxID=1402137 RepID=UPI00191CABE7|nr:hypothetical protein [Microvirga zambiensis]